MRNLFDTHEHAAFLKPGEALISRKSIVVSTILGSCVAVTMFSPEKKIGAICHAMFPSTPTGKTSLQYVDNAIYFIHRKMLEYSGESSMVVKLFGGARVLAGKGYGADIKAVGEQNIYQAKKVIADLGLTIACFDIGGVEGRKMYFSIKTGDVFLRRLSMSSNMLYVSE